MINYTISVMKKILVLTCFLAGFFHINQSNAAFILPADSTVYMEAWKNIKLSEFVNLSARDFRKLSGEKMNVLERISFPFMKMKMKKEIKKNPDLTVGQYLETSKKISTGVIILLVLLGIGVILAIIAASGGFVEDIEWGEG